MSSLVTSLGLTAASGAFTLLDPEDWPAGVRTAYVVVPAAAAAAYVACQMATSHRSETHVASQVSPDPQGSAGSVSHHHDAAPSPRAIALVAGAVGLGTAAAGAASFPIDRGIRNLVARAGARHPRRWMAAGVVVVCLALDAVERRSKDT
ncbi:hypothetical protein [Kocuria sp. ZOR0020]|uniref:hypothetical protein n=1 Tax=Kocuria sp. ZOR0020 TaxID=1339234 RepID=UPI0012E02636|nr:hypothetical protein [Kocuria sp. ZOR0020]